MSIYCAIAYLPRASAPLLHWQSSVAPYWIPRCCCPVLLPGAVPQHLNNSMGIVSGAFTECGSASSYSSATGNGNTPDHPQQYGLSRRAHARYRLQKYTTYHTVNSKHNCTPPKAAKPLSHQFSTERRQRMIDGTTCGRPAGLSAPCGRPLRPRLASPQIYRPPQKTFPGKAACGHRLPPSLFRARPLARALAFPSFPIG